MRPALRAPVLVTALALVASLGVTLAGSLAAAGPAEARRVDQSWGVPGKAWVTIRGRGYGHGHGMSQHGAEGAARRGLSALQIVRFYYPGLRVGRVGGRMTVRITADTTDDVVVLARRGLRVRDVGAGRSWLLPTNGTTRWRLVVDPEGRAVVQGLRGRWRRHAVLSGEGEFTARGAPMTLVTPSGTASYRGRLRAAAPSPGSRARDTVNTVGMQAYLRGVVPREIPASWSPAAVQAQAIAARTYAAFERNHPRAGHYQVCDTTSCQVYDGADAEHPASDAAIRATRRRALFDGDEPAFTQFHSSSGGWTSAGSRPYLTAQRDPYDDHPGNSVHAWNRRVTDVALERAFPAIGNLRRLRVTARTGGGDFGGRVGRLVLVGTRGRVAVSGSTLRSRLGLRSDWFTFRVRRR